MRPPRSAAPRRGPIVPAAFLLLAVVVVPVLLASCGGASSSPATPPVPNTVTVADFAYSPDSITVHVGDTVTWAFHQPEAPHNVVALTGPVLFNSGAPQGKGTFAVPFTQPGTYTYICQVHPTMKGTVIVNP